MAEEFLYALALIKLFDYVASGVGATAGPLFLPWRALMEGKAKRITARADANTIEIIAQAHAKAKQYLVSQDADKTGALEFTRDEIFQRIEFQERKRIANIASVVESAAHELGEREVPDYEPDHDWTARFFDCIQDVSNEHLQKLWAKVLSGEVESPGRTSLRTLDAMKNMTQRDAEIFEEVAGYVIGGDFIFFDSFVLPPEHYGSSLKYSDLLHLQDCGLANVGPMLAVTLYWRENNYEMLSYHDKTLAVLRKDSTPPLQVPAFFLTVVGRELLRIAEGSFELAYLKDFSTFLHTKGCELSILEGEEQLPGGRLTFANRTLVEPRPIEPGMQAR